MDIFTSFIWMICAAIQLIRVDMGRSGVCIHMVRHQCDECPPLMHITSTCNCPADVFCRTFQCRLMTKICKRCPSCQTAASFGQLDTSENNSSFVFYCTKDSGSWLRMWVRLANWHAPYFNTHRTSHRAAQCMQQATQGTTYSSDYL